MARHVHSTLSDEGIDDADLMDIEPQQRSDHWSRGSIGRPSSAAQSNVEEVDWQFQEDAAPGPFSSAQTHDEQLPETVPIPSQLEDIRLTTIETIEGRDCLDFSETCTTAHRSSPFAMNDAMDNPFEFVSRQSQMTHLPASEDGEPASLLGERPGKTSKRAKVPRKTAAEQMPKKPYNTRSGPKVSYADGESSSDEDNDLEEVSSLDAASHSRAQNANKKTSPDKSMARRAAKEASPKRKRREERVDSKITQTAETRRRRQRPKTPLPIDDETQRVPTTLLTTPPVTDQRPKKCQKRQSQRLSAVKPKPQANNKKPENASPAAGPMTGSEELGSEQSAHVLSDARSDNGRTQLCGPAHPGDVDQNEEEQDGSSVAESIHSTRMTIPSVQPSPQRISSMQVPLPFHQLPPPLSLPLVSQDVQDSIESMPAARPPLMGDLSILMSRNVSRRDEDIGHRLQEIHKASAGISLLG
ncbi:hypothetical protein LEL_06747 [Akanthomyces lecanii RCEF 1005]|uniref:Uncharacterized protein n=1 Tax=Akanthomyces lecanii RCEF 1005 TaxID=1081108 RepID=A0A168GY02_CORDF|nr:hypothetical protein LEL_06747 [Akanthomyces lecanii RCEF 1005]